MGALLIFIFISFLLIGKSNTKVKPDSNDINDLLFAMKVAKHV